MLPRLPLEIILAIGEKHVDFAASLTRTSKQYRAHFQPRVDRAKEAVQKVLSVWKSVLRVSEVTERMARLGGPRIIWSCSDTKDIFDIWNTAQNEDKQEIILDILLSLALAPSVCMMARAEMYYTTVRQAYEEVGQVLSDCGLIESPLPQIHIWSDLEEWFETYPTATYFQSWGLGHLPKRTEYLNDLMDPEDEDSVYEAGIFLDGVFADVMNIVQTLPRQMTKWIARVISIEM